MDLFPNFDDEKILGLFSLQNKIGENQIQGFQTSLIFFINSAQICVRVDL